MTHLFPREDRQTVYLVLANTMVVISIIILFVNMPNKVNGFDFATDEWDQARYASPVSQWVAQLDEGQPVTSSEVQNEKDLSTHLDQINRETVEKKTKLAEAVASGFSTPDSKSNFSDGIESVNQYLEDWDKNQTAEKQKELDESLTSFTFTN